MPTTEEQVKAIKDKNAQYAEKVSEANTISGGATNLYSNVMEAVRSDRAQRGLSSMAQDVGATTTQLGTDTAGIKERTGAYVDPTSVDYLTSRQRSQNLGTLAEQATQSRYNEGTLSEIIQEGTNRLKAMAEQKLAEAQKLAQEADNLRNEWEMDFKERQFTADEAYRNRPKEGEGDLFKDDAGARDWMTSYLENLSDEDKQAFLNDLETYSKLGYPDETIISILAGKYGQSRVPEAQRTSMQSTGQPYQAPAFASWWQKLYDKANNPELALNKWWAKNAGKPIPTKE